MIDARFPPQPEQVNVPLYPTKEIVLPNEPSTSEAALSVALQEAFSCEPAQLVVGESASSLLRTYLYQTSETNDGLRVGIPAYCCQSVVDAVIDSGSNPVFYDIAADTSLTAEAVEFLAAEGCEICVWPTFFGSRERDQKLVDRLHEVGISIVYDEAQADMLSDLGSNTRRRLETGDIAIYSFGASKMLAGTGGGALYERYISDEVEGVRNSVSSEPMPEPAQAHSIAIPHQRNLATLLELREYEGSPNVRINPYDAAFALNQLDEYTQARRDSHDAAYEELRQTIAENFGIKTLSLMEGIEGTPAIVALNIAAEDRYDFMARLSSQAVQTTWYYYPINRISRYRDYPAQRDAGSAAVAESVVVLPFQWTHTDAHRDQLLKALIASTGEVR